MRRYTLRRVNRILIVFALIGLLLGVVIAEGTATNNLSIPLTTINSGTPVEHNVALEANYTAPYTITILPSLVWNETTDNPFLHVGFRNASNEVDGEMWEIWLAEEPTATLRAQYGIVATMNIVGSSNFTMGTEITVSVDTDGFSVHNGTDTVIEYFAPMFDINGLWAWGKVNAATSGICNVEFSDGGDFGIDILISFMPLLVTIAVLGMVMKSFDRLGGR